MSSSSKLISLKLLIHKTSRKVLFGEADHNFINFLLTILSFPVATILHLISTQSKNVPLINLHHSLQNLSTHYFQENCQNKKSILLNPKVHIPQSHIPLFPIQSSFPEGYYGCVPSLCYSSYFATKSGVPCPGCSRALSTRLKYVRSSPDDETVMKESWIGERGYVKEMVSYMVMDDLTVKPMSAMSTISMLAEFGVDDVGLILEKVVHLDQEHGLSFLKALLCSSTVLSDVFLHKIDFGDSSTVLEKEAMSKNETLE